MGQSDVYYFLKDNEGWFTSREIAKRANVSFNSVGTSLKRLRESEQVDFMPNERRKGSWLYKGK
jgi:Mn-dependent DtxR family transcriptional regulator